ncbi:sporulation integral membrane protein YtvI [Paenibacillus shirakamiensis]|uniref:Sporulation integral membrane protein YtvI n=1 Tax=Paenibacillus shirakamiensis TaxID=1265935 RepID=A0ABS4JLF8_9BACL|nr:sporulation integral membrane protein YtvI [Paenibacillus shirakamiensis]MBP2002533.1 sporulation integral membrane protein YtvI [Paenibacillus shirakamiensis]
MDNLIVKRMLRGLWVLCIIVFIFLAVYWLFPLIYPFLIAWVIAYAMNPFVGMLQRKAHLPKWLAVTLSILLFFGGTALVLSAVVTRLVKEIIKLTESFDLHIEEWKGFFMNWAQSDGIQNVIGEINNFIQNNPDYQSTITQNINKTTETISTVVTRFVTGFLNGVVSLLTSLPNLGVILIVVILATFFISKGWDRHVRTFTGWMPVPLRKTISDVWGDLQKALFGYLRAQFIMISITAVIVFIGLLILGVDSAFALAILIGFVDLLPYLGVGTIMVPWLIYTYMSGDIRLGIGLSIVYGIILIARQVIEPKVLASSVGLDPLPTLIGMFVGLKLFGVVGLIIGPVSFVVISAINRANVFRDLRQYIVHGKQNSIPK